MTDPAVLIAWLKERQMSHKYLAHLMQWSPSYIYGYLGGAWDVSPQFVARFAQVFGAEIASQIFPQETAQ